jgi:hypothetical protein
MDGGLIKKVGAVPVGTAPTSSGRSSGRSSGSDFAPRVLPKPTPIHFRVSASTQEDHALGTLRVCHPQCTEGAVSHHPEVILIIS